MELMASHDFQTALQNYLDLEDLRSKLIAWKTSLDAFDEWSDCAERTMSRFCRRSTRSSGSWMRGCACASSSASTSAAPAGDADRAAADHLATAEERIAGERIALIEKQLGDADSPESLALRQRAARLRGALTWRLETEYQERLTAAHVHLNELNAQVDALTRQYDAFVRTRQAATTAMSDMTFRSRDSATESAKHSSVSTH